MPNIMIVGFGDSSSKVRNKVEQVIRSMGLEQKTVTTVVDATVLSCAIGGPGPYLAVRDRRVMAHEIAKALNRELNLDVEVEELGDFRAGKSRTEQNELIASW